MVVAGKAEVALGKKPKKRKPQAKCPHGKQKSRCTPCRGTPYVSPRCVHGITGSGYYCKECPGKGICEHRRQRSTCKECGGSQQCPHGTQRSHCVVEGCGGSALCIPHKTQKSQCFRCNPDSKSKCEHGRLGSRCVPCGGASVCEHKKLKWQCVPCGGSQTCEHGSVTKDCLECDGRAYCKEHKQRYCRDCRPHLFCEHDRQKGTCLECMSLSKAIASAQVCSICCSARLGPTRRLLGTCAKCDATKPPRMEHVVWGKIESSLSIPPTMRDNKVIGGAACAADRTRPDLCWVLADRIVHVEIDEHSHEDREVSCELKKLDSANWGLSDHGFVHLPTWTVRFNCSEYDGRRINLDARCKALTRLVNHLLTTPSLEGWDALRTNVTFMYYHSKAAKHIAAARAARDSILVHDVML